MSLRSGIVALAVIAFSFTGSRISRAADQDALVQQMTSLNTAALTDYGAGDFEKAKSRLLQAVALAKKDDALLSHPILARTYIHLGVLLMDGLEDRKAGIRYFSKALEIRPDIEITEDLVTKSVRSAFDEAGGKTAAETAMANAEKAESTKAPAEKPEKPKALSAKEEKAARLAAAKEEKAAREAEAKEQKAAREAEAREEKLAKIQEKQNAKELAAEKKRADAESKQKDQQAQQEKDKLMKDLAQTEASEAKERAAKEKLAADKQEKEKALAETKTTLQQLQKDLTDKEKTAAADKDKLEKALALTKDSEAKERAAKEKVTAEKQDKEKQLADAKAQIAQLQKDKTEKEKLLADALAREKKEREAKEKLDKDRLAAEAREKDRKAQEESARAEKEKLAAGPEIPSHFAESVFCTLPDEALVGQELFVHCLAQPSVKAKELAIFYRASGGVHYNSLTMEPGKKGWKTALIPANRVTGKLLQYYVEARDAKGGVAASNGKPSSPNILTLRASMPASAGNRGGKQEASMTKKR